MVTGLKHELTRTTKRNNFDERSAYCFLNSNFLFENDILINSYQKSIWNAVLISVKIVSIFAFNGNG